jgi:hypothetical protein
MKNCTLLINSSDGFIDCWDPFFELLHKYWDPIDLPIVLNTEFLVYKNKFNVISSLSHISITDRKLTWSECLINALDSIETPFVIYMQEDYFIDKNVNINAIKKSIDLMTNNDEIKYIGLTNFGNKPPFHPYHIDEYLTVSKKSRYRISTQAGLWRKETLRSYLKPSENGWMFEIFGTQRARRKNHLFLTCNPKYFNEKNDPIFSYIHTGIIKGKWHKDIPNVFNENSIIVDFNIRGFYKEKNIFLRKSETILKLLNNPIRFCLGMLGR